MKTKTPFIWIDYTEFKPNTYKAVVLEHGPVSEIQRFETGDPIADWARVIEVLDGADYMSSSTVDSFISDDPSYELFPRTGDTGLIVGWNIIKAAPKGT